MTSQTASVPFLIQPVLLLLLMQSLMAKPYGNYGFYSPYPPPRNQVLYDFRPLATNPTLPSSSSRAQSRSTRDLTWKEEYDAFIDGKKEPTCRELREMWLLAREMQRRSMEADDAPASGSSKRRPFLSFAPLKSDVPTEMEPTGSSAVGADSKEVELQVAHNRFVPQLKADRRRMSSPKPPQESVYGIVKTHAAPTSKLHVRDPAKEIYGLLRERSASKSAKSKSALPVYSSGIRTHEPSSSTKESSYLDQIKAAMLADEEAGSPLASSDVSAFGKVRSLVSASRLRSHQKSKSRGRSHHQQGVSYDSGGGNSELTPESTENAFDLIRERLMNTRLPSSASKGGLKSRSKSLRRKNSKKRRRNVSNPNSFKYCIIGENYFLKTTMKETQSFPLILRNLKNNGN